MPYEGYEYYYGRELVIAIPPHNSMRVEAVFDATDTQAVEIKDLYHADRHLVRFCSTEEDGPANSEPFELANAQSTEQKLIVVGGSRNGRKWWLSTPIVRWNPQGLVIGFSDRHERAMNDRRDAYANTTLTITFTPIPPDSSS